MRFEITSDDHILTITEALPQEAGGRGSEFENEEELRGIAAEWPMKRLVEIWNRVPGVTPVRKFENCHIAIARLWRAIEGQCEPAGHAVRSRRTAGKRVTFREGSKAAQVCSLLARPEGATLEEIRSATGWQSHTVRGFISRNLSRQGRRVQRRGHRTHH